MKFSWMRGACLIIGACVHDFFLGNKHVRVHEQLHVLLLDVADASKMTQRHLLPKL